MRLEILYFFFGAFILAVICGPAFIPLLRKLKVGQTIRDNGPQTHLSKQGTPTMGGVIFLLPMVIMSLVAYFSGIAVNILPMMIVTVLYACVGFADDFIKVVKKNKNGLLWYQKLIILMVLSVIFALYIQENGGIGTIIHIDFFGLSTEINLSYFFIPFCALVMIASSNSVNITDGLDGLCAGSVTIVMAFFTVVSIVISHNDNTAVFASIIAGGLIGFLLFNFKPAKVFMGDTGSLALGAAVGTLAITLQMPLILLLAGLLFVVESLSVLLQVSYFKITHGKRILKMAPLHHHFELCGWSEKRVVYVFWLFTIISCIIAYLCVAL